MNDKTQSRKWLLTINNPVEHGYTHDFLRKTFESVKNLDYWCLCDEVGKNNTYHTHIFLYRTNPMRFQMIKNKFPKAHIDYCRGTSQENRDYIRKEGKYKGSTKEETNLKNTFEESGNMPVERQGQRNDLIDLYDMIKSGMDNYSILEENPEYMLNLDKIERCRQVVKEQQFRNVFRNLTVEYYSGKTGAGKTRSIMERYGYENVYRITDYLHPFDGYRGQDVVVFEEFRSSLKIQDMLNLLDGYPLDLPCRYNNKVACYTKVYLISNIDLESQYPDIQNDYKETWLAFLRRINAVKVFDENGIKEYHDISEYLERFKIVRHTPFDDIRYQQEMLDLKSIDTHVPWET